MINVSIKRPLGAHLNKTVNKSILSFSTRAFQGKRPSWNSGLVFFFRSVANRSQVLITHSQPFEPDACAKFWPMSTQDGVMADEGKLSRRKISRDNVYKTLKTHTKYGHIVRGRPTLKEVERFLEGVGPWTLWDTSLWVNLSSRNMPYQLSYLMIIERSIDANLIVYVDVIVNQAEYQYEIWKG